MKLFTVLGSPNGRKVLSVINHLGDLDVDVEYLDIFEGELKTDHYISNNINGMVPTFVDDNFKLWESNAINQYLCDLSSNKSLYPTDTKIRADINRWLFWEVSHYNRALGTITFEELAKPAFFGMDGNKEIIDYYKENLKRFASVLNDHMDGRQFVVGDSMTIADYAITHVDLFKDSIDFDWSEYPNVNAMYDRIRQNENWMSTLPQEGQEIGRRPAA